MGTEEKHPGFCEVQGNGPARRVVSGRLLRGTSPVSRVGIIAAFMAPWRAWPIGLCHSTRDDRACHTALSNPLAQGDLFSFGNFAADMLLCIITVSLVVSGGGGLARTCDYRKTIQRMTRLLFKSPCLFLFQILLGTHENPPNSGCDRVVKALAPNS